jgi:tetraacyldisaccharide 4'-kinase
VDLLLMSAESGVGNGWLLPAGPMREPLSAARRADALISVKGGGTRSGSAAMVFDHRLRLDASLRPRALVSPAPGARWTEHPLALMGRRVVALSGLADASGFYRMLRALDADLVGVLEYPDHHSYSTADWHSVAAAGRDGAIFVTTEKDLVKLERFPFARDSLYALRLEVAMDLDDEAHLMDLILSRRGVADESPGDSIPSKAKEASGKNGR